MPTSPELTIEELCARCGLTPADVDDLRRQGAVCPEFRQRAGKTLGPYYKLRWRSQGKQRVAYLGRDGTLARAVQALVLGLQASRRFARGLLKQLQQTRADFSAAKKRLEPMLPPGFYYHGHTLRRRRGGRAGKATDFQPVAAMTPQDRTPPGPR